MQELSLCRTLGSILQDRFAAEALALLSVIPRSDPISIRIARWASLAHLRGPVVLETANEVGPSELTVDNPLTCFAILSSHRLRTWRLS